MEVILPVLDAAEAIPLVLAAIPAGFEPLVVDNGSGDGSAAIARRHGVHVVVESRPGFGAACYAELRAARAELVCLMDCDGLLDPGQLPAAVDPVAAGRLQLCLGTRRAEPGAWSVHARLANRLLAVQLRRRARVSLTDIGPMRCVAREPLLEPGLRDRRFGWPLEMVLRAAAAGWEVGDVEVTYRPRVGGASKVSGSLRGSWRAVRDMCSVLGELA